MTQPAPPPTLETGPSTAAPDADQFYCPGCWVYVERKHRWRPGFWLRNRADLDAISNAVDALVAPLGRRVHSIVNYDSFVADPDILDRYADLVKYVEERYYINVSRYSTSGFLRLKLGAELRKRRLSSHVFETRREARRHLGET